jgi:HK97 family phage major capsid protein
MKNSLLSLFSVFIGASIIQACMGLGVVAAGGARFVELTESRKKLLDEQDAILEHDELTDEQRTRETAIETELKALESKIEKEEVRLDRKSEQDRLEARASQPARRRMVPDVYTGHSRSDQRDIASFSLGRALRMASQGKALDGAEAEFAQEGADEARAAGISVQSNAIMIGSVALRSEQRDHTVGTANQGGNLVQTNKGNLLDALFESLVFGRMGNVDMNTGLVGNLEINKIVRGTAPAGKAENAAADEHSITFEAHPLTPRRLPTYLDVSKQLFLQSSEGNLERRVTNHVTSELRVQMEKSYILDILGTAGIGAIVGGTNGALPVWADIVNLAGALTAAEVDPNMIQYLINTSVETYLMTAPKTVASGEPVDSIKILSENSNGRLAARNYLVSNVVPNTLTKGTASGICSAILAADFSGYSIGQWGGMEFLIDPYTQATTGMSRIHCAVYHDGVVNDAAKFAAMQDVLTA